MTGKDDLKPPQQKESIKLPQSRGGPNVKANIGQMKQSHHGQMSAGQKRMHQEQYHGDNVSFLLNFVIFLLPLNVRIPIL